MGGKNEAPVKSVAWIQQSFDFTPPAKKIYFLPDPGFRGNTGNEITSVVM